MRLLLDDMLDQWRALDMRIKLLDDEFVEMARNDPAARWLATIPKHRRNERNGAGGRDR